MPTVDEAGLPGFHISVWHAVWARKRTEAAVVAKLNDAVVKALADARRMRPTGEMRARASVDHCCATAVLRSVSLRLPRKPWCRLGGSTGVRRRVKLLM